MAKALRVICLSLCLGMSPAPVMAQDDGGVLIIRQGGQEIGRETFRKVANRSGSGLTDSLITTARFPNLKPRLELSGILQRSAPDAFTFLVNRRGTGESGQMLAAGARNRITVRIVGRSGESAREFPGGPGVVLLDDSLFAPFIQIADLVGEKPTTLTALFPRSGRRTSFQAERVVTPGNRSSDPSIQEIRLTGGLSGELVLDAGGKVLRVDLPELGFEASRATE